MAMNDITRITKREAVAVFDSTAYALERAGKITDNLLNRMNSIRAYLDIEAGVIKSKTENEFNSNIMSLSDDLHSSIRMAANALYGLSVAPPDESVSDDPQKHAESHYRKVILPEDRVLCALEDDGIYVRTPMLWSRQNRRARGDKRRAIGPERSTAFRESVHFAVRLAPNFESFDFVKFEKKILHYLYVYRDLPSGKMFVIDNDNHETKAVTDAIVKFLPSGDYPLHCNFYSSAIVTNDIPEGTYITVTTFSQGVKPDTEIVQFWKKQYDFLSGAGNN